MKPAAPQQLGLTEGLPDVLMVDPSFGVFAGDVEPVRGGAGTRPCNRDALRLHVESGKCSVDSRPGEGQELDEQRGRDSSGRPNPILVGLLDQLGQRKEAELPGPGFGALQQAETTDVISEQM